MSEEEKNEQQPTQEQTGSSSSQQPVDQSKSQGGEHSLSQPATDDSPKMEDERTGEGTGSRAGEYS